MPILNSEDEDSEEYESGSSDEYSEDEEDVGRIMKPVFVPRSSRVTIHEVEKKQKEEQILAEKKRLKKEERKSETRALLAESIRRNQELEENHMDDANSDAGMPDDTDGVDDELENEAWKVREIQRLRRDAEEREADMLEKAELLRRRNMTDAERLEEDIRLGYVRPDASHNGGSNRGGAGGADDGDDPSRRKFMQKYYHKGAFYMDEATLSKQGPDDVRRKDYASAPTLEDKIDKEKLPEVMRVKNFGKRGRTKYTHLLDQDTTVQDKKRVDVRPDRAVMNKYLDRRSGVGKL